MFANQKWRFSACTLIDVVLCDSWRAQCSNNLSQEWTLLWSYYIYILYIWSFISATMNDYNVCWKIVYKPEIWVVFVCFLVNVCKWHKDPVVQRGDYFIKDKNLRQQYKRQHSTMIKWQRLVVTKFLPKAVRETIETKQLIKKFENDKVVWGPLKSVKSKHIKLH